jgi:hypothetical protein
VLQITAAVMATSARAGNESEAAAFDMVAHFVAINFGDEAGDIVHTKQPNGNIVVTSRWHTYLVASLHTKENAPQELLVRVMIALEYAQPDIRRVLSRAKGEKVDDANVRKLVRRVVPPKSAPST